MKRSLTAIVWLATMLAARAADTVATLRFNPDLSAESNPIVSLLGGGWTALLVLNALICAAVAVCTISYSRAQPRVGLIPCAESAWDFAALALYGVKMGKFQFLRCNFFSLSLPPKRQRPFFWQLLGFALPPAITTVSLIAAFSWIAIRGWRIPWFIHLHREVGYLLAIIPGLFVLAAAEAIYFSSEYRRARQSRQAELSAMP